MHLVSLISPYYSNSIPTHANEFPLYEGYHTLPHPSLTMVLTRLGYSMKEKPQLRVLPATLPTCRLQSYCPRILTFLGRIQGGVNLATRGTSGHFLT